MGNGINRREEWEKSKEKYEKEKEKDLVFHHYQTHETLEKYYHDIIKQNKGLKLMTLEFYDELKKILSENPGYNITYVPQNVQAFCLFFNEEFNIIFMVVHSKSFKFEDNEIKKYIEKEKYAAISYGDNYIGLLEDIKNDYVGNDLEEYSKKLDLENFIIY